MLGPQHLKRPPMVTASSSSSSLALRPRAPPTRPTFSRSESSSSSLGELEQSIKPFQDFIKQTRAVGVQKPLPPTPPTHSFDSSPYTDESRSHLLDAPQNEDWRRSSSVYSRAPTQWIPDAHSFQSLDISNESYPEAPNLHVSGVSIRQHTPVFLESRACSPLIASPSPTLSAVSTPLKSRPPTLTLDTPFARERPKVRMMSLDKANRTFNAPGAIHLLPEELRAQSIQKSDARKYKRADSEEKFGSPKPPPLPPATFDYGGKRSQSTSTGASVSPFSQSPRDSMQGNSSVALMNTFHVGTGPARTMNPSSPLESPRRSEEDERRGRKRERRRSSRDYSPPQNFFTHHLNVQSIPEQRGISHRQLSAGSYKSEDDVRGHMKLIPQPLFQAKSPTQHRRLSNTGSPSSIGYSTFRTQRGSQESASSGRSSGFPLRLSLTPPPGGSRHRQSKSSTTGMIPISPPNEDDSRRHQKPSPIRTNPHEARISSLYPHTIGRNKKKKDKQTDMKPVLRRPSVGTPLLPADVVAAALLTPETTPQTSPLASNVALMNGLKRAPSGLSADGKRPLYERFKGITKHVRRGSKQRDLTTDMSPVASPQSPHLYPSPVKALQQTHLGWSETAKATWDQARSGTFHSRGNASQATSPDEDDPDSPTLSRPTLFGPFMESYRETKAQKRREVLKRKIKVVAPLGGASEAGVSDEESEGDIAIQKRLSFNNWM